MSLVITEKKDGYAIVTLNRPDEMNALSKQLRADIITAFTDCQNDENIRVMIVTGKGRAFCAGFDLKEMASSDQGNTADEVGNDMAKAVDGFKGVVIGAINGHAVTGGFELALACDVLIASENARFADTHARVGILPGWGLSQKLPRMIGLSRAKEISFTGAPVFAQQALDWGIVNHVVPAEELLSKAEELAQNMCACVPHILKQYKPLIEDGYNMPYKEALAWEEQQAIESARQMSAFMMKQQREKVMDKGHTEKED
jgi:enoyl-CoA hydratase/carnithine racemase